MQRFPITQGGLEAMQAELKRLKHVDRPTVIQAISEARELGDLSENAEYHAARERQGFIEGRIMELEDKVSRAEVIDPTKLKGETITFGATVSICDADSEETRSYQITSEYEADLSKSLLSIASPLAKSLIGKRKGDVVEFMSPSGPKEYEILSVSFD